MALYTSEQLQIIFQRTRERNEAKRTQKEQREARLKAAERLRKKKHEQHQARLEKEAENARKRAINEQYLKTLRGEIPIYRQKYMERQTSDDDLYTKEELMNPPEGEYGKINWTVWDRLVEKVKNDLISNRT